MVGASLQKCLFPVAGLGTRFLPATKDIPKEMLPLLDRPIIHYGVDEAVTSGCRDIVFVTGRSKRSIEDYFDRSLELEHLLERRGQKEVRDDLVRISEMANFAYVRQSEPLGLGHAVLCGEPCVNDSYFGLILPDDVILAEKPVLGQLAEVHAALGGSVLALEKVPWEETSRYGIIEGSECADGIFRISNLVEKPASGEAPSRYAIIGRYLLSPTVFRHLRSAKAGVGGEIQLTDALRELLAEEPVFGLLYKGERLDCGTKKGWLKATVTMALRDPELKDFVMDIVRKEGSDGEGD
ncbi:MAG: UTP--glucose-1-phosphate uridylyltransferase GalU [Synergistales bacterium]|jgi:UTP--glucose-1-phosphate uridylyltransferase